MKADILVFDKDRVGFLYTQVEYDGGDEIYLLPKQDTQLMTSEKQQPTKAQRPERYAITKYEYEDKIYVLATKDNAIPLNPEVYIQTKEPRALSNK